MDQDYAVGQALAAVDHIDSMDGIRKINDALRRRSARIVGLATDSFCQGEVVLWTDKQGREHEGTVARVNRRTVSVLEGSGPWKRWKIDGTLLRRKD